MSPPASPGTIALDAMGNDLGPAEIVEGLAIALRKTPHEAKIIVVGDRGQIEPELERLKLNSDARVSLLHASQVIGMDEKPISGLKRGTDSSMVRALDLVKDGKANAVISCGNTGSLMAGGTIKLRPLQGIERPALACVMPKQKGHFVLCDVGANPSSRPEHLVHNAILASHYAEVLLNISKPRVGLLTIGTEEGKGTDRIHATHQHLKELSDIVNYHGPIEGFQVFEDHVDVVITDGFTGNVLLKSCEGLYKFIKTAVREEFARSPLRQVGGLLSKGAFASLRERLSPEQYGGARLLGLRGHVFKAHGSSNRLAVAGAIRIALAVAHHDMTDIIRNEIDQANRVMNPTEFPQRQQAANKA